MRILFVINPGSGAKDIQWREEIEKFFEPRTESIECFELEPACDIQKIQSKIQSSHPDRVVAVGGDGTVKLVAESLLNKPTPIGIIPGGSANGLAKELGIPLTLPEALQNVVSPNTLKIHAIKINDELCIHLADLGFNAFVVKKFESGNKRGMFGYIKAAWKVLWQHSKMSASMKIGDKLIARKAAMIVVANATRYGSGAIINPDGKLDDGLFEVVIVKRIAVSELYKMMISHNPYDPAKTEVFQTEALQIKSAHKAHFQVDGEYLGKVNAVEATVIKQALTVIVP